MKIFKTISELKTEIANNRKTNKPTMGALHEGHISLLKQCKTHSDISVVSIFVNPTQFNNPEDYVKYPVTLDSDIAMLEEIKCDILFNPSEKEMYPEKDNRIFNFGALETTMEGSFRPGHFNGVAQIVSKLFDAVTPDYAFFGEKDFQQLAVIKSLVKQQNYNIKIIACPIIREKDGLAMSSRNVRLSEKERQESINISKELFNSKDYSKKYSVEETIKKVISEINKFETMKVEYFEIFDPETFLPIKNWTKNAQACIAVNVGNVRLIDNISYA